MNLPDLLRRSFYFRYPLFCGIILAAIGPFACLSDAQQLLGNTLLLETWWQAMMLTTICLIAATLCFVQAGMVIHNGVRFGDLLENMPEKAVAHLAYLEAAGVSLAMPAAVGGVAPRRLYWEWSFPRTLFCLIAGLSLPFTAVVYSALVRSDVGHFPNTIDWTTGLAGILSGVALYMGLVLIVVLIESHLFSAVDLIRGLLPIWIWIDPNQSTSKRLLAIDRVLAQYIGGTGYKRDAGHPRGTLTFRPGHWQQGILLLSLFMAYIFLAWLTAGSYAKPTVFSLPTSFFAVGLLMYITVVLSVAAFFLDYYRVPVLLLVALGIWGLFKFSGRDHYFEVTRLPPSYQPADLLNVIDGKSIPADRTGRKTLVIVTAPGGGIHAAAWTAQVLTGLHCRYGSNYAQSIGLISGVSGGSVGTMYYAANFATLARATDDDLRKNCQSIVERAGGSGLEAVGWGAAYRDVPGLLPFIDPAGDRGKTLDECWQARLFLDAQQDGSMLTLASWREAMAKGEMPIVVFNSTEVESGRRVLFSPVVAGPRKSLKDSVAGPVEFSRVFATTGPETPYGRDISVVTAARLSATFPWVSPTATPRTIRELGHLADGGYIDNEGILTAVDWVSRFFERTQEAETGAQSPKEPGAPGTPGAGPSQTIVAAVARSDALQSASGKSEGAKQEAAAPETLPTHNALPFDRVLFIRIRHNPPHDPLEGGQPGKKEKARDGFSFATFGPLKAVVTVRGTSQIERGQFEVDLRSDAWRDKIDSVFLDFRHCDELVPPLSWKLSPKEFARYAKAWDGLIQLGGLKKIDEYFEPAANQAPGPAAALKIDTVWDADTGDRIPGDGSKTLTVKGTGFQVDISGVPAGVSSESDISFQLKSLDDPNSTHALKHRLACPCPTSTPSDSSMAHRSVDASALPRGDYELTVAMRCRAVDAATKTPPGWEPFGKPIKIKLAPTAPSSSVTQEHSAAVEKH